MTDLEMTRLCAEAMELIPAGRDEYQGLKVSVWLACQKYDPLHDDAQAMALVKRCKLKIDHVGSSYEVLGFAVGVFNEDLNRAIVECVARMQEEKEK